MQKNDFYEQVRDYYFENLDLDFEAFKVMIRQATPVFGTLETVIEEKEDGGKIIDFIDNDEGDFVVSSKEVNVDEVNTTMRSSVLKLHLDENDIIQIVEHSFGIFTPVNKGKVLLYAHFIGKKIVFSY